MTETQQKLDDFHQFAMGRLRQADGEIELDDLLLQWYDFKDKDQTNATIRQGLADIDAGLGKPASVVANELRTKFGSAAK